MYLFLIYQNIQMNTIFCFLDQTNRKTYNSVFRKIKKIPDQTDIFHLQNI